MSIPREGESIMGSRARPDYVIEDRGYETPCWVWQKSLNRRGYPSGRRHRDYWAAANGPIPDGHDVHHRCYTPPCVNPDHLIALTEREHDIEDFLRRQGRDVEMIRKVREEGRQPGASMIKIAEKYGLNHRTVLRWWNGQTWGDLIGEPPIVTPRHICAMPGCDNVCEGNRHKQYCCPQHRSRTNHYKRKGLPVPVAALTSSRGQKP